MNAMNATPRSIWRGKVTYRLTETEIAALTHVAAACGRKWRAALSDMWMNGSYGRHLDIEGSFAFPDIVPTLQRLRNNPARQGKLAFTISQKDAMAQEIARRAKIPITTRTLMTQGVAYAIDDDAGTTETDAATGSVDPKDTERRQGGSRIEAIAAETVE